MQWTTMMRRSLCVGTVATAMAMAGISTASAADSNSDKYHAKVDVLNWWTSGSEAKAMGVLQQMLAKKGVKMVNDAVAGGGGANMRTVLKSRVQSLNAPGYAQITGGPRIEMWCQTGLTGNIDAVAKAQNWSERLPPRIAKSMKCNGHWVAVPFEIHRINWLWINKSVMKKAGAEIPHTWFEFVSALKQLKKAGVTPIASGGGTWQVGTMFDAIVSATGDAEFYRNAFVKLKPKALSSDTMVKAFKRLRTVQQYTNPATTGLSWNRLTHKVVNGQVAMQIMGDWAKGEISIAGATPGKEIACVVMPGSKPMFLYNVDSFVAFKTDSKAVRKGQKAFARTVLTPEFQRRFSMAKGSIPVREGVSLKGFDPCAKKSAEALAKANKHHALLPSMSQGDAVIGAVKGAIFDVVANFWNSPNMSAETAANMLARRVKQVQRMIGL